MGDAKHGSDLASKHHLAANLYESLSLSSAELSATNKDPITVFHLLFFLAVVNLLASRHQG